MHRTTGPLSGRILLATVSTMRCAIVKGLAKNTAVCTNRPKSQGSRVALSLSAWAETGRLSEVGDPAKFPDRSTTRTGWRVHFWCPADQGAHQEYEQEVVYEAV